MGAIAVHEFVSLDGVFEDPGWTFDYGFDPGVDQAIGAITGPARAILLGRLTVEMFAPAWSTRTVEDDPGAPLPATRRHGLRAEPRGSGVYRAAVGTGAGGPEIEARAGRHRTSSPMRDRDRSREHRQARRSGRHHPNRGGSQPRTLERGTKA